MKKFISVILLISMLSACLFGCGRRQASIVLSGDEQTDVLSFDPTTAGTDATMKEKANNAVAFYDEDDATTSTYDPNASTVSKWVDGDDEDTDPDIDVAWVTANAATKTYTIASASELAGMLTAQEGGETFEGWKITLGTDIDLGGNEWIQTTKPFKGEFDGGNHVIANYKFTLNTAKSAFFGAYAGSASLKNVALVCSTYTAGTATDNIGIVIAQVNPGASDIITIDNVYCNVESVTGFNSYVGFIDQVIGTGKLIINNCEVDGADITVTLQIAGGIIASVDGACTIEITDTINNISIGASGVTKNHKNIGGFFGQLNSDVTITVRNCKNNGDISVGPYAGGFIGHALLAKSIAFEHCTNMGDITCGFKYAYSAGFVGTIADATTLKIKNCINEGNITGSTSSAAGGFVGWIKNASANVKIEFCKNNGNFTGTTTCVGGMVGNCESVAEINITNCENSGAIKGNYNIGGIIGDCANATSVTISSCSNSAIVEATATKYGNTGGVAGRIICSTMQISSCTNTGTVSAKSTHVGGILGMYNKATGTMIVENCINDAAVTSTAEGVGGIIGNIQAATSATILGCESNGSVSGPETMVARLIGKAAAGYANITISGNTYAEGVNANLPNCGANLMEVVGYQTRDKNGSYDLRYIASFNRAEGATSPVYGGFVVTVSYLDGAGEKVAINAEKVYVDTAYTTIVGGENTYLASQYGASYLCALIIYDIPAEYTVENGTLEVIITPFTTDDKETLTNSYTVIHGGIVDPAA